MEKQDKVRWLHISDFHFTSKEIYNRDTVTNALISSFPNLRERYGSPHKIFATGDIAYSGQEAEYQNASVFFDKLLEVTNLTKNDLFVIPGNHDVDRTKSRGLNRTLAPSEIDEYFDPSGHHPHITQKLSAFIAWFDKYFEGIRSFPRNDTCNKYEKLMVGSLSMGVLAINTACFCYDDNDSGNLIIGMRCLDNALSDVNAPTNSSSLKLAIMHHPLNWLSQAEGTNVAFSLRHNFDCILSGHLHTTKAESIAASDDVALFLAAGATYQHPDFPKTAMLCECDGSSLRIIPIRYEPSPSPTWTLDTSIYPHNASFEGTFPILRGKGPPIGTAKEQLPVVPDRLQTDVVAPPSNEARRINTFEEDLFRSPAGKIIYVEPRIMSKSLGNSLSEEELDAARISMEAFTKMDKYCIVEVRPECGGTSLCKRLDVEISKLRDHRSFRRVATELPNYKRKLIPVFSDIDPGQKNILILDDFMEERDERLVKEILSLGFFHRIILVTTNRAPTLFEAPEHAEVYQQFIRVYLWPMNREDIRCVTQTLFDTNDEQLVSQIVDKVYLDLLALCIPLTPTNVIMYLKILHREGQFQPINRVDLIDRYLQEILLSPAEAYADTFNVKNKLDILSAFVYKLYTESRFAFEDAYWFFFVAEYQKACLFEFNGEEFLSELIRLRLFSRWDGKIYIKYSFFFNFLLGRHLLAKPRLLQSFLQAEEYLRVGGVLEVISGLSSDNGDLLDILTQKLEDCVEEFSLKYFGSDFDPFKGTLWLESSDEENALWRPVNEKIASGPKETTEIDKIKSSLLGEARTHHQIVDFTKFSEMEYRVFSIERLVKDVFRNSDDVYGDIKMRAFRAIQASNLVSFQVGSYFAPVICRKPLFKWFGVTFIDFDQAGVSDSMETSEEKVFETVYSICSAITSQSAQEMAASKLTPVFRNVLNEWQGEVGFHELLAFNSLLYARGLKWAETLEQFIQKVDRRSYYLLFCLTRMITVLKNEIMPTRDRNSVKRLIVLIQTKRLLKTQSPGERALKRVEAELKDQKYPPLFDDVNNGGRN